MAKRIGGLLRGDAQLRERLTDLLRACRLRLHPLVHRLEVRRERLHLVDDLGELHGDLSHGFASALHFFGELVHPHHARRHRRLHFLHELRDVERCRGGLVCKSANFACDHREATAVLARLLRLDCRIERQQVRLVGHLVDCRHDHADVRGFFAEQGQARIDEVRGLANLVH